MPTMIAGMRLRGVGSMKCQRCPKQATLHITEVLGEDRFEEVHLCEDCAKKYLYEPQQKKTAKGGDKTARLWTRLHVEFSAHGS